MNNNPNEKNPKDIQGLVVFRNVKSQQTQEQDVVSLEYIDQENKIKLVCKLEPFGSNYLYSLLIINQSMAPITEIKIRIRYPDFLVLCRSNPPKVIIDSDLIEENEKQIRIEFEKLEENSQRQINTYFTPLSLEEKGEIRSYVTFINNADFVRALDSDPVTVKFDPISIERKILPSSEVRNFLQLAEIKRGIKSFGIGIEKVHDFDYLFYQLNQTIEDHNLQLITKDDEKKIAWYFGTELVSGSDLLVIGQLNSNKIELLVASQNPQIIISILTNFATEYSNRLLINGIIETLNQVHDLECKYCGAVLPYFPTKGESVECTKCKYEKIIWS
ncbi:MAG: hypothetical protein ACFFDN_49665 [Candidatus Hodarchaeota archaeon]